MGFNISHDTSPGTGSEKYAKAEANAGAKVGLGADAESGAKASAKTGFGAGTGANTGACAEFGARACFGPGDESGPGASPHTCRIFTYTLSVADIKKNRIEILLWLTGHIMLMMIFVLPLQYYSSAFQSSHSHTNMSA